MKEANSGELLNQQQGAVTQGCARKRPSEFNQVISFPKNSDMYVDFYIFHLCKSNEMKIG